jgi:hypothetical protein
MSERLEAIFKGSERLYFTVSSDFRKMVQGGKFASERAADSTLTSEPLVEGGETTLHA